MILDKKSRSILGNPWFLFWMVMFSGIILTGLVNWIQSLIWYGHLSSELLAIGTIDAVVVVLIVAPIAIRLGLSHQKQIQNELRELALTDELTEIYNRRGFNFLAEHLIKIANRTQTAMYLMFADLDDFKAINDKFGHAEGDKVLREFSRLLKKSYRESDIVARLGGDEFVLLPVGTSKDGMDVIQNRFHKILTKYNDEHNHPWKISASIGIAYYDPVSPIGLDDLLRQADEALYRNKKK